MKVSTREKKVLYAGIVLAVAIMIYYAATLFSPGDGESLAEKVNTQESLLRRQKEFIGREDFYKKFIEESENDITKIQTRLLPGNSPSGAATELHRILSDFAEDSGVVITQRNNQPERKVADSESLTKVSVRIGVDCQLDTLVDFLIAIKNYDKFLKVEELLINTALQQKQLALRRPLYMIVAGYISTPLPDESTTKPGENTTQASSSITR